MSLRPVSLALAVLSLWSGPAPTARASEAQAGDGETQALVQAPEAPAPAPAQSRDALEIGGVGFVDYSFGRLGAAGDDQTSFNRFKLTRGYLSAKAGLVGWLSARITSDLFQDDKGNYALRLKYLYGEVKLPDLGPVTQPKLEIGMGHMPWLDFEEAINPYRCQGTQAIERAGVFASADLGVSVQGTIGGELADAKGLTGNAAYAGRFGSWHLGVYNGGGYAAAEANENKVFEARLTVRPLPDLLPGLQLSGFAALGEGNKAGAAGAFPGYRVLHGMLSFEHPWFTLAAQTFLAKGNAKGDWVDADGAALEVLGLSGFARAVLPGTDRRLALYCRLDRVDQDRAHQLVPTATYTMVIAGAAFELFKGNLVLAAFEGTFYGADAAGKGGAPVAGTRLGDDVVGQVVYQIKF